MPLPKPNKGESKKKFVDRCMGNSTMNREYPKQNQRRAVCESQWDSKSIAAVEGGAMTDEFSFWFGSINSYLHYVELQQKVEQSYTTDMKGWEAEEDEAEDRFQGYGHMMQEVGDAVVISISGELIPKSNWLTRMFGLTGYDDIGNALAVAVNDGGFSGVILDIDSPGGSTSGLDDVANKVKEVDSTYMPVLSFTSGKMASAAYRIGSAAREVYSTRMATVGSIGVVAVHTEFTEAMKKNGVTPTVMRAGKYKMLGNPYEKLSKTAKDVIQSQLDYLYDDFVSEVAENRGLPKDYVEEKAAEGQVFFGEQAVTLGLVNAVSNFEGVVKRVDDIHNSPNGGSPQPQPIGASAMLRKKVLISEEAKAAIAAGVPEAQAIEQFPADPPPAQDPQAGDPPAQPDSDPDTQAAQPDPDPAPAAAAAEDPPAEEENQDQAAVSLDFMTKQLKATQDEVVELKVQLKTSQDSLASLGTTVPSLMSIARAAIQKMQVGLGQSPSDLKALEAPALVEYYNSTEKTFNERFHIGATAQVNVEEGHPGAQGEAPALAPTTQAAIGATAFRKEDK